jgi:uncharacterized membrane protein
LERLIRWLSWTQFLIPLCVGVGVGLTFYGRTTRWWWVALAVYTLTYWMIKLALRRLKREIEARPRVPEPPDMRYVRH